LNEPKFRVLEIKLAKGINDAGEKDVLLNPTDTFTSSVMPDLIRHPVPFWIPAFEAPVGYLLAGVIIFHNSLGAILNLTPGGLLQWELL
jgi:hypothetical protein